MPTKYKKHAIPLSQIAVDRKEYEALVALRDGGYAEHVEALRTALKQNAELRSENAEQVRRLNTVDLEVTHLRQYNTRLEVKESAYKLQIQQLEASLSYSQKTIEENKTLRAEVDNMKKLASSAGVCQ